MDDGVIAHLYVAKAESLVDGQVGGPDLMESRSPAPLLAELDKAADGGRAVFFGAHRVTQRERVVARHAIAEE